MLALTVPPPPEEESVFLQEAFNNKIAAKAIGISWVGFMILI
jgi:hypothetical protein